MGVSTGVRAGLISVAGATLCVDVSLGGAADMSTGSCIGTNADGNENMEGSVGTAMSMSGSTYVIANAGVIGDLGAGSGAAEIRAW